MRHSLSKWSTFNQCPAKYKYQYVDKLPRGTGSEAMSRGVAIHKTFEDFINHGAPLMPPFDRYHSFIDELKAHADATVLAEGEILVDSNWQLTSDKDAAWIISILDMSVVTPSIVGVYDWKSGKIYDEHKDQKELYSLMAHAKYPEAKRIEAHHVYVDLGKNTKLTYDISDLGPIRDRWTSNFKTLEYTDKFIPMPSFKCRFCDYSKAKSGPCPF